MYLFMINRDFRATCLLRKLGNGCIGEKLDNRTTLCLKNAVDILAFVTYLKYKPRINTWQIEET